MTSISWPMNVPTCFDDFHFQVAWPICVPSQSDSFGPKWHVLIPSSRRLWTFDQFDVPGVTWKLDFFPTRITCTIGQIGTVGFRRQWNWGTGNSTFKLNSPFCNLSKWPLQFYYHQRPLLFKLPFFAAFHHWVSPILDRIVVRP